MESIKFNDHPMSQNVVIEMSLSEVLPPGHSRRSSQGQTRHISRCSARTLPKLCVNISAS